MAFVKLDCGMLDSTIWIDRDAREVFVTALLMASPVEITEPAAQISVESLEPTGWCVPPGWYGFVAAAGPGIIRRAGVDPVAGLEALKRLGNPEAESRTPDHEGRRMVRVSGGYIILNFIKYREKDATTADRSRRWRERQKMKSLQGANSDVSTVATRVIRHQAEAEAEAEADRSTETPLSGKPDGGNGIPVPKPPPIPKKTKRQEVARPILHYLNEKAGRQFRETDINLTLIAARCEEVKDDLAGVRQMIDRQCARWKCDPQMSEYLRPETLFGRTKFNSYYDNRELPLFENAGNGNEKHLRPNSHGNRNAGTANEGKSSQYANIPGVRCT